MWNNLTKHFALCYIKSTGQFCILMNLEPMHYFVTLCFAMWKTLAHWVMYIFQMLIHFMILKKQHKTTFVNTTTELIRQYLEPVKLKIVDTSFPELNILWKLEFITNNTVCCSVITLIIFEKLPNTKVCTTSLSSILSSKNCVPWEND
jgi:hypothetical protein